jgi:hypothetical protein
MPTPSSVRCTRCKAKVLEAPLAPASVSGTFTLPVTGSTVHFFFCGMCALLFREFVAPEVVHDSDWQEAKQELISTWS